MEEQAAPVKVSCPHCAYTTQISRSRIPAGGARATCPKCGGEFRLRPAPPEEGLPAPLPAPVAEALAPPPALVPPVPAPAGMESSAAAPPRAGRSGKENRQYRRIPFAVDVLVNKAILMKAIDISQGGLYVHTGRAFIPGSTIEVELPLGAQKISVKGSVQHNQNGVGIGIRFLDLSKAHQNAIFEFMRSDRAGGARADVSRKRVLLVDEDAMKRRMSKSKLILEGFSVVDVEDGFEAIRRMEEEPPDLVILDLFMRKMDGFKVLTIIKESPKWKDIPVLIYSSKGSDQIMDKVLAAGATEFLLKAMTSPTKLAEIVKKTLSSRG